MEKTELVNQNDLGRKYLLEVFDSGILDNWPGAQSMADKFQTEWAEFNESKFCALVTNGSHTLQLALEALNIGAGDEVIVPGLTWQATASAICDVNAIPILVDVNEDTLGINTKLIEKVITSKTKAIIPVHLYHRMANIDEILNIAKNHNLIDIEDAAHTHGSPWQEKSAGTFGTFGSFSCQSSKLMNSGEGGALLMQDEELYWKITNFTATHGGLEDVGIEDIEKDILAAQERMVKIAPHQQTWTFAYPCYCLFIGQGKKRQSFVPLIAKHFLAGRGQGESGFGNHPDFIDTACVWGIRVERMSGFEMIGLVEELTRTGLWVILAFHEINGDRLSVQREDYLMLLNYLKRKEETIWCVPVGTVAQKIIDTKK